MVRGVGDVSTLHACSSTHSDAPPATITITASRAGAAPVARVVTRCSYSCTSSECAAATRQCAPLKNIRSVDQLRCPMTPPSCSPRPARHLRRLFARRAERRRARAPDVTTTGATRQSSVQCTLDTCCTSTT